MESSSVATPSPIASSPCGPPSLGPCELGFKHRAHSCSRGAPEPATHIHSQNLYRPQLHVYMHTHTHTHSRKSVLHREECLHWQLMLQWSGSVYIPVSLTPHD